MIAGATSPDQVKANAAATDEGRLRAAAEGCPAHLLPERARGERLAAAAALVVPDAAQPHVHDLTSRAGTGHLAEEPLQQGATATAEPGQVDDPWTPRDGARARPAGERVRAQLITSFVS